MKSNKIQLLEKYYGDYYFPVNWETRTKKSRNYFAVIKKGNKDLFSRKFIRSTYLDDQEVFNISSFPEGAIVEQKCTYVKGTKSEVTFGGFFIISYDSNGISAEKITQKDALEYFDCREMLPEIQNDVKNKLRVKLGIVVRKLTQKYSEEIIAEVLTSIIEDYFPKL